jgi:hypothetical protein
MRIPLFNDLQRKKFSNNIRKNVKFSCDFN